MVHDEKRINFTARIEFFRGHIFCVTSEPSREDYPFETRSSRALLRSERIVNWLRWFLDVEKNPFRSIGAVAAALAFIASVAIILVSAGVSRISEAT
jgi:hypothetical protein